MSAVVKSMGKLFESYGLKPSVGRVFAYVCLSSDPVSAADLKAKYKISHTMVTEALQFLRNEGLIELVPTTGREFLYRCNGADLEQVLESVNRNRHRAAAAEVKEALEESDNPQCSHLLQRLSSL